MKNWFTESFDGFGATVALVVLLIVVGSIFGSIAAMFVHHGCP